MPVQAWPNRSATAEGQRRTFRGRTGTGLAGDVRRLPACPGKARTSEARILETAADAAAMTGSFAVSQKR